LNFKFCSSLQVSADARRQTRATRCSRPVDHRAVHRAEWWAWSTGDGCRSSVDNTWPHWPSPGVVSNRPTTVACLSHSATVNTSQLNLEFGTKF